MEKTYYIYNYYPDTLSFEVEEMDVYENEFLDEVHSFLGHYFMYTDEKSDAKMKTFITLIDKMMTEDSVAMSRVLESIDYKRRQFRDLVNKM